jgi:ribonucleotide reductase beta subunit family protein with ferritin-like domain
MKFGTILAIASTQAIQLSKDKKDFNEKMNDNERYFIENILAFFAASDGIVKSNKTISLRIVEKINFAITIIK